MKNRGLFFIVSLSDKHHFAVSSVGDIGKEAHTLRMHFGKLAFTISLPSH